MVTPRKVKITRSARKHRIGVAHILAALDDAGEAEIGDDDRRMYVGRDDRGIELEIIMVNDGRDDTWAIIHVMPTSFKRKDANDE